MKPPYVGKDPAATVVKTVRDATVSAVNSAASKTREFNYPILLNLRCDY